MIEDIQYIYVTVDKKGEFHFYDRDLGSLEISNLELSEYFYIKLPNTDFNPNELLFKIPYSGKLNGNNLVNCTKVMENQTDDTSYLYIGIMNQKNSIFVVSEDGDLYSAVACKDGEPLLKIVPKNHIYLACLDICSKNKYVINHNFLKFIDLI